MIKTCSAKLPEQQHRIQRKATHRGQGQRCGQPQVFAQQQLQTGNGQGQQQVERAALALTHNGIKPQEQGNQGNQVNDQTDQAGNGELNRAQTHLPLMRATKIRDHQRKNRKHKSHGQNPAVAHAVAKFLAGQGGNLSPFNVPHRLAPQSKKQVFQ